MEIGIRNIELARKALEDLGASVVAEHVGDIGHRQVIFDVWSGDVWVRHQRLPGNAGQDMMGWPRMKMINVLVVDDSATVRQVMSDLLKKDPEIRVIATASDPLFAMEHMKKQWPDVVTLDVEMPRMDGISFLKHLMSTHPTPVVICSSLTEKGAETTMQAMAAGAVSIVTKPQLGVKKFLEDSSSQLIEAVKAAAQANMKCLKGTTAPAAPVAQKLTADAVLSASTHAMAQTTDRLVAIGTSTGGTQALEVVLTGIPGSARGL